jgi:GNAT superfamily N-acetyltransferase
MLIGDDFFFLELNGSECFLEDGDPSHYAYSIHGTIVAADEEDNKTLAGKFHVYYLDVLAAFNANASVFDIFDCRSDTLDYYGAIFEPGTLDASPKLTKLFGESRVGWGNVLIINRLEVLPQFRGHNLGLIVMRRLIERFSAGAFVVGIKPFPLQREAGSDEPDDWSARLDLGQLDKNLKRATSKLRSHYARLGFKLMKGTSFMFLTTEYDLPAASELLKMVGGGKATPGG